MADTNVVLNSTAYSYEFLGITFKQKSARPVTGEQKKELMTVNLFKELIDQGKFEFVSSVPDRYKTDTQRLNETLAELAELKEKADPKALEDALKEIERLKEENAKIIKEAQEEIALLKKGGK